MTLPGAKKTHERRTIAAADLQLRGYVLDRWRKSRTKIPLHRVPDLWKRKPQHRYMGEKAMMSLQHRHPTHRRYAWPLPRARPTAHGTRRRRSLHAQSFRSTSQPALRSCRAASLYDLVAAEAHSAVLHGFGLPDRVLLPVPLQRGLLTSLPCLGYDATSAGGSLCNSLRSPRFQSHSLARL